MKLKKYIVLFIIIIFLGTLSVVLGLFQALMLGSILVFVHGLLMNISKKYKGFVEKELGTSVELSFSDKDSFYKDHGVNNNSKFNKFFNSEMFLGIFAFVQILLNLKTFSYKISIINAVLIGLVVFMVIIVFDILFSHLAKRSATYSDFYWKVFAVILYISIPLMFSGILRIALKQ